MSIQMYMRIYLQCCSIIMGAYCSNNNNNNVYIILLYHSIMLYCVAVWCRPLSTADHLSGLVNTKHRFSENPSGARSYIQSFNRTHVVVVVIVSEMSVCFSTTELTALYNILFFVFLFLQFRGETYYNSTEGCRSKPRGGGQNVLGNYIIQYV